MKPTRLRQRMKWIYGAGVFTSDTLRQRRIERRVRDREAREEIKMETNDRG